MRKSFFRYFFGFILVIGVILAMQICVFLIGGKYQEHVWTKTILEGYVKELATAIDAAAQDEICDLTLVKEHIAGASDDRVSGLLLRDAEGNIVMAYGRSASPESPFGWSREKLASLASRKVEIHDDTTSSPQYVFSITQTRYGAETDVALDTKAGRETRLPGTLEGKDIAGRIMIVVNGALIGGIDVLTFRPSSYKPLGDYLRGMTVPYFWSLAAATLLSLALAYNISKKNQRYTKGIEKALGLLAKGEYDISLPPSEIEENKAINEAIGKLDEQLRKSERARREWIASISHDLNTPVASMKLLLDGMTDGVFPSSPENIRRLKRENDDLADRIARVMLYCRLLDPETKVAVSEFSMDSFLDEMISSFGPGEKQRIVTEAEAKTLKADRNLLGIAVKELLANALKESGGDVRIRAGKSSVEVMNDGTLPQGTDFFEPWTKGDKSRGEGGNGLGLPIAYLAMKIQGGKVSLSGTDGKVVAKLTLPGV